MAGGATPDKADVHPDPTSHPTASIAACSQQVIGTGVYDYRVMTSAFVPLDGRAPRGVPVKISFLSQEWRVRVYDAITWRDGEVHHLWHSYFDGEADGERTVPTPTDALFVDAMPLNARDLAGPLIAPG